MKHALLSALLGVLILPALVLLPEAQANESDNVEGYAWSDTVGWISFNCITTHSCSKGSYGVTISAAGALSGYAWSEHLGWITFEKNELGGCPITPCEASLVNSRLSGWARVLSGIGNEEWDGWIRLGGASYAPVLSGNKFAGYAWGGEVTGWISFDRVRIKPNVAATLSGDASEITQGEKLTLSWRSDNALSCESAQFDTKGKTVGQAAVSPLATVSYALTCTGIGGESYATYPVSVIPAAPDFAATPSTINEGSRTTLSWSCPYSTGSSGGGFSTGGAVSGSASVAPATTTPYILQCNPHGREVLATVEVLHPQIALTIRPNIVRPGDTPLILWSASLVNKGSCELLGPGVSLLGESGSSVLPPVTGTSTYTLSCETAGGSISTSATVNLIPNFR